MMNEDRSDMEVLLDYVVTGIDRNHRRFVELIDTNSFLAAKAEQVSEEIESVWCALQETNKQLDRIARAITQIDL
jgi:hypothetical protein